LVYVLRFTTKTVSNWGISGSGDVEGEAITGSKSTVYLKWLAQHVLTQIMHMGSYLGRFQDTNSAFAFLHNFAISCNKFADHHTFEIMS
jgi:hypothetical protein